MGSEREYELKCTIAPEALSQLMAHPALAPGFTGARSSTLKATYFDTPDHRLSNRGISLRVRDDDGEKTATLKAATSLVDRGEWETKAAAPFPDMDWLRSTPHAKFFDSKFVKGHLDAAFTVTVERTAFMLREGLSNIEAALDRGTIEANGRTLPVCEFELELKDGSPADLFTVVRRLVADLPLWPSLTSKAERGFRLLDGSWGNPVKQKPAALTGDMGVGEAFQMLVESCLHEFLLNAGTFRVGGDIEATHRARVTLRRLRAALTLFKPRVEDGAFGKLHDELKWLSDLLGAARDLDVFQTEIFEPAAKEPAFLGGAELATHMRDKQQAAQRALGEALQSKRWRMLLIDLIAWLMVGDWRRGAATNGTVSHEPARDETLVDFVAPRLKSSWKRVVRRGASLGHLAPDQRHKARIEAKKLRYDLEFFAEVPSLGHHSKPYAALQEALTQMQGALGTLHDLEATRDKLHAEVLSWPTSNPANVRAIFAAGMLAVPDSNTDALLTKAKAAYRKVKASTVF